MAWPCMSPHAARCRPGTNSRRGRTAIAAPVFGGVPPLAPPLQGVSCPCPPPPPTSGDPRGSRLRDRRRLSTHTHTHSFSLCRRSARYRGGCGVGGCGVGGTGGGGSLWQRRAPGAAPSPRSATPRFGKRFFGGGAQAAPQPRGTPEVAHPGGGGGRGTPGARAGGGCKHPRSCSPCRGSGGAIPTPPDPVCG